MVVSLRIFLVNEMSIVRTDQFDAILLRQLYQHLIGLLLQREGLTISTDGRVFYLVALQLQIIVISEDALMPFDRLTGPSNITFKNLGRHLTSDTCGTDNQTLMILLQLLMVCTRTVIEAVHPGITDQFDEILITLIVFGKNNQVITSKVFFCFLQTLVTTTGHIHLTTENRFKGF